MEILEGDVVWAEHLGKNRIWSGATTSFRCSTRSHASSTAPSELGEALGFTLSQVADLLGLRTAWIWLIDDSSPEPYLAAARNLPPVLADDPRRMDGSGYCYCLDTYKKGDLEGAANVNVLTCSRLDGLVDGTGGLRYHASIPLRRGEGSGRTSRAPSGGPSPEDLQLLSTIGGLLYRRRARPALRAAAPGSAPSRSATAWHPSTLAQGHRHGTPARVGQKRLGR